MEKEKIGFYCSSISWGGLEMNFVKCAIWLVNRNYRVKLYCVEGSPIAKKLELTDIDITYVRRNRKYFDLINALRVYKLMKTDNIKGVWLRDTRDLSTIGLTKNFSRNNIKVIYQQAMQIGVPKKDLIHTIRFSKIDAWIALLNNLAAQVQTHTKLNPEKIHIIPLAVDLKQKEENKSKKLAREKFKLPQDKFVIGILGRISHHKGQLFLIEQLEKLRNQHLDIEVLIVGESTRNEAESTAYEKLLKETVEKMNLTEHVHFHPFITEPEIFYTAIDLFVMASEGETFGTVTIEAMTCGVPVLGTNASGTPEILDHGKLGFLYEVNDGPEFCKQVDWIYNNPDEVDIKTKFAQKTAQSTYSQEVISDQIEVVLEQLNLGSCKLDKNESTF